MSEEKYPGFFITFEGGEGGGKSTVMRVVVDWMKQELKLDVVATREPGGTRVGDELRGIVHNSENKDLSYRTEALVYQASRAEHVDKVIVPSLKAGKIVVSDRFGDSSVAYQGAGRELGEDKIRELNEFSTEGLSPDLTLYLEVDLERGLERRRSTGHLNRMDQQDRGMYERAHKAYKQMCKDDETGRWVRIDANPWISDVIQATEMVVRQRLIENDFLREDTL